MKKEKFFAVRQLAGQKKGACACGRVQGGARRICFLYLRLWWLLERDGKKKRNADRRLRKNPKRMYRKITGVRPVKA